MGIIEITKFLTLLHVQHMYDFESWKAHQFKKFFQNLK